MIYHTVGFPRSGTTYLHEYCRTYHNVNNIDVRTWGELFTQSHYVDNNKLHFDISRHSITWDKEKRRIDTITKIKFLKNSQNNYSFKVIPNAISKEYRDEVLEYLNNCNLLTIRRNPFDRFLSFTYQHKTKWKEVHGAAKSLISELRIDQEDIDRFLEMTEIDTEFLNNCKIYHTFDYENLNQQLFDFFKIKTINSNIKYPLAPMQIDYKSLVLQYELVKEKFYESYRK